MPKNPPTFDEIRDKLRGVLFDTRCRRM